MKVVSGLQSSTKVSRQPSDKAGPPKKMNGKIKTGDKTNTKDEAMRENSILDKANGKRRISNSKLPVERIKSAETGRDEIHISEYRRNRRLHVGGNVRHWADLENGVVKERGFTDVVFLVIILLYMIVMVGKTLCIYSLLFESGMPRSSQ